MTTHLDNIRDVLQQTDSGRRALAVLEAVQDYDAHGDYGDDTGACPCEVCRAVRALLAEAGEAAANPSPTCQLAARARDYREYHHRLEAGQTIDLGLCATTGYVLDVELRNGCPLGKETRIPGDEPVASKTDAREVADTRPEAATRQPATATRNLLAGSEMVVQFRPPPDRPIDVGEGWELCHRGRAEQHRTLVLPARCWSEWREGAGDARSALAHEYRRRVRRCATCRYWDRDRSDWPCVDCNEYDKWEAAEEGGNQ